MIRFSAVLVVVAIGVLVGGMAASNLLLVYVAIGLSMAALAVLALGVALKREEFFGEQGQLLAGGGMVSGQQDAAFEQAAWAAPQRPAVQTRVDMTQTRVERPAALTQVDTARIRADLAKTRTDLTETKADLTETKADLIETRTGLTETKADLTETKAAEDTDAEAEDSALAKAPDSSPDSDQDGRPSQREVIVVPGVPRYHDANCILIRFMGDDELQKTPLDEATEAGCTPCRACVAADEHA